ncbi:MAG: hypothetical protein Q8R15_01655 [Candidatus Micrarchaeota archaeon]|nr:hypothetical protein [Candidatus Micrarchaeota archaeon]
MENESILVEYLGRNPVLLVIDFLLENKLFDYSKQQIAEGSGIGRVTLFNNWNKVEKLGIVKETRRFGKTKLYKLNEQNAVVKKLIELELLLGEMASEKSQHHKMKALAH